MRTLVIVRSLKVGGMERVAVNLADAFAQSGCDSHLLTLRQHDKPLAPTNPAVSLHHFSLTRWQRATVIGLLVELISRWFLNPVIRRSHFVWTGWLGGYLFRWWLRRFERRHGRVDRLIFRGMGTFELIWTFRDERARFVLENIVRPEECNWRRRLFARCLFQGKHLVAVSEGVKATLEQAIKAWRFSPKSLSVIVNPCPTDNIRRLMAEPEADLPNEPYIVNVARLVPAKDHALLIRAYARAGLSEKLVIVGEGRERGHLQQLASQLGVADRVIFAGHRDNPYPWVHGAKLFVLSSRFEGMGIVLFEALACGTPVLSVDCRGGVRQILKGDLESALVPRNETALADRMWEVMRSERVRIPTDWIAEFKPEAVVRRFLAAPV